MDGGNEFVQQFCKAKELADIANCLPTNSSLPTLCYDINEEKNSFEPSRVFCEGFTNIWPEYVLCTLNADFE